MGDLPELFCIIRVNGVEPDIGEVHLRYGVKVVFDDQMMDEQLVIEPDLEHPDLGLRFFWYKAKALHHCSGPVEEKPRVRGLNRKEILEFPGAGKKTVGDVLINGRSRHDQELMILGIVYGELASCVQDDLFFWFFIVPAHNSWIVCLLAANENCIAPAFAHPDLGAGELGEIKGEAGQGFVMLLQLSQGLLGTRSGRRGRISRQGRAGCQQENKGDKDSESCIRH